MNQEPEDDDLEPEYDFSAAERGKYYPRSQEGGFAKKAEKTQRAARTIGAGDKDNERSDEIHPDPGRARP